MVVGILTIAIFLPESHSLKDKRRVLKSLKDRLRSKHNISVAEVDGQELWQRATVGIAAVSNARVPIERLFEVIQSEIEGMIPGEIIDQEIEFI